MKKRLPVLVLALALLVPGFGRAETRTAYPPFEDSRADTASCFTTALPGTCSVAEDADWYDGRLAVDIDVAGPGVAYGTAQPQVWGYVPMNAGSRVVITATFRILSASVYRTGLLATATDNSLSNVYATAFLHVRHDEGCRVEDGCLDEGSCAFCESASTEVTIVDVSSPTKTVTNEDVTVTVTLDHPSGQFPAANLYVLGAIYAGASLSMYNAPGEGTAGVSVDAVLTKVVAVIS